VVVDASGNAIEGNPTSAAPWSKQTLPEATSLTAVACASYRLCIALDATGDAFIGTPRRGHH
jgi:hypothetical protein